MKKIERFLTRACLGLSLISLCSQLAFAEENILDSLREVSIGSVAAEGRVLSRSYDGEVEVILVGLPVKVELKDSCITAIMQKNQTGFLSYFETNRVAIYGAFDPTQEDCDPKLARSVERTLTFKFTRRWSNPTDIQMIYLKMRDEVSTYYLKVDYVQNEVLVTGAFPTDF